MIIYLKVHASEPNRPGIPIDVSPENTTKELKRTIETKLHMITDGCFLLYGDKIMENNKTLKDYGILQDSAIYLVARVHGGMQIFIKHMGGNCTAMEVSDTTTVAHLKQAYSIKSGIRADEQRLLYGGQQLVDKYTMKDYKIVADSAIHVVFRLRGGKSFITQKLISMDSAKILPLRLDDQNRYAIKDLKTEIFCVYGVLEKEQ